MAKKKTVSNEQIFKTLLSMDTRMDGMDERIREIKTNMATKDDLQKVKEEILEQLKPVSDAVDKDAVTVVNDEKRITRVEKHLSLAK